MLTEFTEYGGKAEVLGVSRRVSFAAGVLSVCGLTMEQANEILRHLTAGEQATTEVMPTCVIIRLHRSKTEEVAEVGSKAGAQPGEISPEEYAAQEEEEIAPSSPVMPRAGAKEEPGSTAKPPQQPASGEPPAPAAAPAILSPVAEVQVPAAKEHLAALTDEAKASAEEDQLVHALRQQTLVKGILTVLEESGCVGLDALTARCVALKDKVPLLGHITNFNERIARTYGLMHPGQ